MTVQAFTYNQVCPVVFGNGVVTLLGQKAKEMGMTKVLLVTDEPMTKLPPFEKTCKSLDEAGIKYVVYSDVTPDPKDTEVLKGAKFGKDNKVDGIIALGGGSAIDAAKAMNLLINNPEPLSQYYFSLNYAPLLPQIAVPTASGTGSEATIYSVITEEASHAKRVLLVKCSLGLVDPELTYSLPPSMTAATGMDALAHVTEAVTSNAHNPKADILADYVIKEIFKWLPVAVAEPENKEARYAMSLAANLGGVCFSDTCCHLGHGTAHSLGVKFHVPHGFGCAWALPETMKYSAKYFAHKARVVAKSMDLSFDDNTPDEKVGQMIADKIIGLMRQINLKSIKDMGYTREDCISVAPLVMTDATWVFLPKQLEKPEIEEFLGRVYDSYQ